MSRARNAQQKYSDDDLSEDEEYDRDSDSASSSGHEDAAGKAKRSAKRHPGYGSNKHRHSNQEAGNSGTNTSAVPSNHAGGRADEEEDGDE